MRIEGVTNCKKLETGSCPGCPAFRHGLTLVKTNVPVQEVVIYLSDSSCPDGTKPDLDIQVNHNGFTTSRILEGYKV